jgi:hypothetical protein
MDDVDGQLDELERQESARGRVSLALRQLPSFAGAWIAEERLHVGVAGLPAAVAVTFMPAAHTYTELADVEQRVLAEADRIGAALADVGVDTRRNRVIAELDRLADERSQALIARFAGAPIDWHEAGDDADDR